MLVMVIGRGHSGTRAISHTLTASGVYMGRSVNRSGDLVPAQRMYDASRMIAQHVRWLGAFEWGWSELSKMPIPAEFRSAVLEYLASPLASAAVHRGWKLPETTLCYPWIVRMFPDIRYVFWVRKPRDCILQKHTTDDLRNWGVRCPPSDDIRLLRAYSWMYQYRLVRAVPRPRWWIEVRFEDFVLEQERTLTRLEQFRGIPLERIPVRPEAVGRFKHDTGLNYFDFLEPAMRECGYAVPS